MVAKVPDIAPTVDVLLANLEDAIPASEKANAWAGLVEIGKAWDHPDTQFWDVRECTRLAMGARRHHHRRHRGRRQARRDDDPQGRGTQDIQYVDRLLPSSRRELA